MKRIFAPIFSIVGLIIAIYILSYILPAVADFFGWFFLTKQETEASLSTGQAVLIDILTHIITYSSVGAIFGMLGAWNKNNMHWVYVLISESVSLGLALLMRFIVNYYWIIFIVLGVIVGITIIFAVINRRKSNMEN